jgi:hypothetical protein
MREFDVAVLGGGSAGLAAAVTAARTGARVLLVERHGMLGGMGTAALVHTFCGLYLVRDDAGAVLANPGFPAEIEAKTRAATGLGPVRMGRVLVLPQHPVEFARIADELVTAEERVELWFHSECLGADAVPGGGWTLDGVCRGARWQARARALVDASGDAVLAPLLGGAWKMTDAGRLQRPAYIFTLGGVPALGGAERLELSGRIVAAVRRGDLPATALGLVFRASARAGEAFGTIDLSGDGQGQYDPLDMACLSRVEAQGRATAAAAAAWMRRVVPGWDKSWISAWPARAGVRESRRWIGRALLTGDDMLAGRRGKDDIALAAWPMEFRETARGPKLRYAESGRAAGIPLGCLRPAGLDAVYVAGRCISADHDAQASVRVMGTCFATGQAAGLAAARDAMGEDPSNTPQILREKFGEWPE